MAKALTDIVFGKPIPENKQTATGPLAGLTHRRERIAAGQRFNRADLGDEVDDETWQEWLAQGSVSEDDDAELPPPTVGVATAGRDYGAPLTQAEIDATAEPGTHPGSAPGRENPPQGWQDITNVAPAPKPTAMLEDKVQKEADKQRTEQQKAAEASKSEGTKEAEERAKERGEAQKAQAKKP